MEYDSADVMVVRQQNFDCDGPIEVSVELGGGRLDIRLVQRPVNVDTAGGVDGAGGGGVGGVDGVTVQIRPDPMGQPPWGAGIAGLLSWLGEQTGAAAPGELAAEAVRSTVIDFTGQRLTVRTPPHLPLRTIPLIISITAPAGSSISARSGSADIAVDGVADRLHVSTGSGQIRAQRCTGAVDIRTGSGDVRLGSVLGTLRARTGAGVVDVVSLERAEGSSTVQTGSGDVRLGTVSRDLTARTGSGDLTVVDASAGHLELISGAGQLRVGIHPGVQAELDFSSGSGRVRSDLPVRSQPAEGNVGLRVRARTGSGDALITRAPS